MHKPGKYFEHFSQYCDLLLSGNEDQAVALGIEYLKLLPSVDVAPKKDELWTSGTAQWMKSCRPIAALNCDVCCHGISLHVAPRLICYRQNLEYVNGSQFDSFILAGLGDWTDFRTICLFQNNLTLATEKSRNKAGKPICVLLQLLLVRVLK